MAEDKDPYGGLPNIVGDDVSALNVGRTGDPSRFFPSAQGGQIDAVTGRILNVPHAGVYFDSPTANGSGVVASGVAWDVIWDTRQYDNDGMFDPNLPKRLTIRTPGLYLFTAQWAWINNAFGDRIGYFVKNNSFAFGTTYDPTTVAFPMFQSAAAPQPMNAGDYVVLRVMQNSAAGVGLYQTLGNNGFQAILLSTFGSDNQ